MVLATALDTAVVDQFKASLRGGLLTPGDLGYAAACELWNGMIRKRPGMIVRCAGAADVIAAVNFARGNDLAVAVRGGGHNVAGNALCDDGLVIDLSPMQGIRVDPTRRTARTESGVTWGALDHETQAFGLATTGGTVSTTGIAGLTLGGGVGWLMGAYGASCDNLLSVDLVTADGQLLSASAEENADLFWAVRGGGGNFGVVTSFEYRLHPVGPIVVGGLVMHPLSAATEVLRFYREFTATAPDALTTYCGFLTSPEGVPVVAIAACYAGSIEDGERAVAPLKSFGTPIADMMGPLPYVAQQSLMDAAVPAGRLSYWKSHFLRALGDEVIDALATAYARVPSPFTIAIVEHSHGAINRVPANATAFSQRTSPYNLVILSLWEDPDASEANIAWARDLFAATRPFATGVYVNGLSGDEADRTREAYGPNYDRLVAVKNRYDPTNFFSGNQNIEPSV